MQHRSESKALSSAIRPRDIILFDGHCVLCSRWARFVLAHDRRGRYRLVAAQSDAGREIYLHYGIDPVRLETSVLVENGTAWVKSEGILRTLAGLGFPWSLAQVLRVLPQRSRDALYDSIARNRLRFFGASS